MAPPEWALLEREILRANTAACQEFFARYFDERGYLKCVERWGGDDGPDDAIENCNDWPILHALGAPDVILQLTKKAWEGHLRQYTAAKTTDVPFARDGMYYKEFPVKFDWLHNGEGLTVFNLMGLSEPADEALGRRVRRYAGFYMNEDPSAPNYDARHKIIRSLFSGSRGPLMRKTTGLDWAGDPITIKGRFRPGHGEDTYEQMVAHFKDYNDILGDHPQNLLATSLALNAYMLTGEDKYRRWLLEYVDAWRERQAENGYIIPTNVGLDGKIGSATGGRWYGGVYGWAFTVEVPQTGEAAHRNTHHFGFIGFMNAYLLTGDDRYLDGWRKQIDKINQQERLIDGRPHYPHMYGDDGWYDYTPEMHSNNTLEIYYLSMKPEDLRRLREVDDRWLTFLPHQPPSEPVRLMYRDAEQRKRDALWMRYLVGENPDFPAAALRRDFARIRERLEQMHADTSTPDTRLADDPMKMNPASVASLIQLMLGGLHPGHRGGPLHCRLRYFDPAQRRAGVPEDVAALVDGLTADDVTVTLVNVNQVEPRTVVVQTGGYGEHQAEELKIGDRRIAVNQAHFTVRLAPGAGSRLTIKTRRFANKPTLAFPWDRGWQAGAIRTESLKEATSQGQ